MKKTISTICFLSVFFALWGQDTPPAWLNENVRASRYSSETFYTGFAYNIIEKGKSPQDFVERTKTDAQTELVKKIRVKIEAKTQSNIATQTANGKYLEREGFSSEAKTSADAEIVGIKTESYYDKASNTVYAFAYANKYEVIGYYKANIGMLLQQAEGSLTTAEQLEQGGEKAKARKQCEEAMSLLAKVRYAQDLLTAMDATDSDSESLQQTKSENLRSKATQMLARLAQGLYVYVESKESNFGQSSNVLTNKVKAILASKGCSFSDSAENADLKLKMVATTREISNSNALVFCYADVELELYDNHKQKVVFNDELSQKGGSSSNERAGRKALEDAVSVVAEKILLWIE
ncbi:hypothetical protein AGMMS49965_08840 [Bacteroidia bacterium]|nr:hypothetical protein AGMMS49965_08840 [Bacteroidia bacterium]